MFKLRVSLSATVERNWRQSVGKMGDTILYSPAAIHSYSNNNNILNNNNKKEKSLLRRWKSSFYTTFKRKEKEKKKKKKIDIPDVYEILLEGALVDISG